ncbi:MAG: hypothetical protein ABL971_05860 [Vicinamibacterales bacterium]
MTTHVGIWIDHERALIVAAGEDAVTQVQSGVPGHARFTGGGGFPDGNSSQGGGSERRYEERHRNALSRFFDDVVVAIGPAEAVLIFGPGEAKQELAHRIEHARTQPKPTLVVEAADRLTVPQIVAKVSGYFEAEARKGRMPPARPHRGVPITST